MKLRNINALVLTAAFLTFPLLVATLYAGGPGDEVQESQAPAAVAPVPTDPPTPAAIPEMPPALEPAPPPQPDALSAARMAYEAGDYAESTRLLQQGLATEQYNLDLLLLQGAVQRRLKNHPAAVTTYDEILRIDPENQSAKFIQSMLCLQMSRDTPDAGASLTWLVKATEAIDGDPQLLVDHMATLINSGDVAGAVRTYESVPDTVVLPDALTLDLAEACREERIYKEAERLYARPIATTPGHAEASLGLAGTLIEQGECTRALETIDAALTVNPDAIALLAVKGDCQQTINRPYDAIGTYEQVLTLDPRHGHAASETARILAELGCISLAAEYIADALDIVTPEVRDMVVERARQADKRHAVVEGLVTTPDPALIVLGYQDVPPEASGASVAVQRDCFVEQIEYLRARGYQFIDVDTLRSALLRKGGLPPKSVLLTFDGGYASFYSAVMPLLDLYSYPAVMAISPAWINQGTAPASQAPLMTWEQVRAAASNALFTVASFSQQLHREIPMNPQGDMGASAETRRYTAATEEYETEGQFRARIAADLQLSVDTIAKTLGVKPRHLVWPGGACNQAALDEAQKLGFRLSFTQRSSSGKADKLVAIRRVMITDNPSLDVFVRECREQHDVAVPAVLRGVALNLDLVVNDDRVEQRANIDAAIARIVDLGVDTVYVRGSSDRDRDGNVDKLFFPNHRLPVRRDILSHVVTRLKARGLTVYVAMPSMSIALPDSMLTAQLQVMEFSAGTVSSSTSWSKRISPFAEKSAQIMGDIYGDLAAFVPLDGVVFGEDCFLTDKEDFNPAAVRKYRETFKRDNFTPDNATPDELAAWTDIKSQQLTRFTQMLMTAVRQNRPSAASARVLYAPALHMPASLKWLGQDYVSALATYDQVIVIANPEVEDISRPLPWLHWLVELASKQPSGLQRTVFQLNAFDTGKNRWVRERELLYRIRELSDAGARNIMYDSDDFLVDRPRLIQMRKEMSTADRCLLREPLALQE